MQVCHRKAYSELPRRLALWKLEVHTFCSIRAEGSLREPGRAVISPAWTLVSSQDRNAFTG